MTPREHSLQLCLTYVLWAGAGAAFAWRDWYYLAVLLLLGALRHAAFLREARKRVLPEDMRRELIRRAAALRRA